MCIVDLEAALPADQQSEEFQSVAFISDFKPQICLKLNSKVTLLYFVVRLLTPAHHEEFDFAVSKLRATFPNSIAWTSLAELARRGSRF